MRSTGTPAPATPEARSRTGPPRSPGAGLAVRVGLAALLLAALPFGVAAQVEARPELRGRVLQAGEGVSDGTVTLHQVTPDTAGELATDALDRDGRFSFRLPTVPDPGGRGEVYFASVRHQGILYFGTAIHRPIQLDSLYLIQVYDTATAPAGGSEFPVEVRNLFLEPVGGGEEWQVVDLVQIRHGGARTLVAREDDPVWSYPMPPEATGLTIGQSDLAPGGASYEDGRLVVSTPVPPGQKTYLVRYRVPELEFTLPLPGETRRLEIMIREPAPAIDAPGLTRGQAVELEPGSSYRRYAASGLTNRVVEITPAEEGPAVDVRWIAVILALVLTGGGLMAFRQGANRSAGATGSLPPEAPTGDAAGRETILLRIAELDESFEALDEPTPEERERYQKERRRLKRHLRTSD